MKKQQKKIELIKEPYIIIKSRVTKISENNKQNKVIIKKNLGNMTISDFPFYKEISRSYG